MQHGVLILEPFLPARASLKAGTNSNMIDQHWLRIFPLHQHRARFARHGAAAELEHAAAKRPGRPELDGP